MNAKVFVPITDELMYDYPELITAPLTPYQVDRPCFHWSASIETTQGKIFRQVNSRQKIDLTQAHAIVTSQTPDYIIAAKQASAKSSAKPMLPKFLHKMLNLSEKEAVTSH